MKIQRYKRVRRILSFYRINFGLQPPYQLLVDGTLCQAALDNKINLREQLPIYLGAPVELVTTGCVTHELEILGRPLSGALHIANQFRKLKCCHDGEQSTGTATTCTGLTSTATVSGSAIVSTTPGSKKADKNSKRKVPVSDRHYEHISAFKCILGILKSASGGSGEENYSGKKRLIVGTVDDSLTERVRKLPGVPVLFIKFNAILLERPSERNLRAASGAVEARLDFAGHQKGAVDAMKLQLPDGRGTADQQPPARRKRKGPRGPNPLSCKKKRKTTMKKASDNSATNLLTEGVVGMAGATTSNIPFDSRARKRHRSRKRRLKTKTSFGADKTVSDTNGQ